ncbi:uncharacterized protein LOC111375079 [Olea europaea var. sylvestris]|uniref:uncharacterized protein LOC111375079 n=1 Tax=Olea europaea var. sylvestris TaxID=158386 RepID=UPI000C1D0192|nr:uncharacterized protein LOC111375079 [Olea europaea var. sylvestris]
MKESEKVSDYISRVVTVANQMKRFDEDVTNLKVIKKILISVSEKFDHMVTAIEESKDLEDMTIEELSESLEAYEEKLNRRRKEPLEHVLQSKLTLKDKEEKGNTSFRGRGRGRGFGKGGRACKDLQQGENHYWFFDTGARNHMCGDKDLFIELAKKVGGNITFRDSSKIPVREKGKILIRMKDGNHQFISNVYYAPVMKSNILSVGQLLEKYYILFTKGCSVF